MEGLGIDAKLLLAQLFNFIILLVLLKKFLYRPLLKVLDERKKKIEDGLVNAEKIKKELDIIEEEKAKVLREAHLQVSDLIAQERKNAQKEREKIIQEAKQQANEEVKKGAVLARQELDKAKEQLKKEAIVIAAEMTRKILSDLSEEDKKKIISKLTD